MKKRRLIGVITSLPESVHATRVLEGIFGQCEKYGYDVAVFASLTHICGEEKDYLAGEQNIYELMNFELLDGVIVDTISITEDGVTAVAQRICDRLRKECTKPVISLNLPLGGYEVIKGEDAPAFREITEHLLDVHKVKNIYFLSGEKGYDIADRRLNTFMEVMQERGIPVGPEQIFYGNFWYDAGSRLAQRILSGEIPMPEAVICASDHMAIGLVNYLIENGIRVPQDLIVTGFEATQEAAINHVSVTSFESDEAKTAADAVDIIRSRIEPEAQLQPFDVGSMNRLHAGVSCGCEPDVLHASRVFKSSFYYMSHDYTQENAFVNVDIGQLMEGYVAEQLLATNTPQDCLDKINRTTYFVKPYRHLYLCLREDWLNTEHVITDGYPERMKTVIFNVPDEERGFCEDENGEVFETKLMLPQMHEEREKPSVFYFAAVHFQKKMFGYAVLQKDLCEKKKINMVYRNWLRNVNNALEMIQAKNRLLTLSIHDGMTGVYNRRGMDLLLEEMLDRAVDGDQLLVGIIDMDGLKKINDTYGHTEGDFGIRMVCSAVKAITQPEEICVRAGGDEFYLIGVGSYDREACEIRTEKFYEYLEQVRESSGKPYTVDASIGYAICPVNKELRIDSVIDEADGEMYKNKIARKKYRDQ